MTQPTSAVLVILWQVFLWLSLEDSEQAGSLFRPHNLFVWLNEFEAVASCSRVDMRRRPQTSSAMCGQWHASGPTYEVHIRHTAPLHPATPHIRILPSVISEAGTRPTTRLNHPSGARDVLFSSGHIQVELNSCEFRVRFDNVSTQQPRALTTCHSTARLNLR
jgi:hypothetical protein